MDSTKVSTRAKLAGDDQSFTYWNASIVGPPNTTFDSRIYFLTIHCGDNYPHTAPKVKFLTKINIPSVNQQTGEVMTAKFPTFAQWKPEYCMEKVLVDLKNEMIQNRRNPQPGPEETY